MTYRLNDSVNAFQKFNPVTCINFVILLGSIVIVLRAKS